MFFDNLRPLRVKKATSKSRHVAWESKKASNGAKQLHWESNPAMNVQRWIKTIRCWRRCDCLFKSISHQLYGDSSHHVEIRAIGLGYLTDNPERFIEKVVDMTWLQYLSDMSIQGTWTDNIKIQMQ